MFPPVFSMLISCVRGGCGRRRRKVSSPSDCSEAHGGGQDSGSTRGGSGWSSLRRTSSLSRGRDCSDNSAR